uniref:Uncharacterized protein n=1 Tax=Ditylenchus dipsaci TaxID=166011 RepID=A0A915D3H1_9BILA
MRCCEILTKEGVTSLNYHADNHNDVRPLSNASLAEALQKFVVCSCQLLSVLSDKPFVSFLDDFQKLTIQNYVIGHTIPARNLLPSPNTISRRITYSIDTAKIQLLDQIAMLKQNGGGITLDFAKKGVDYLAVTAHI